MSQSEKVRSDTVNIDSNALLVALELFAENAKNSLPKIKSQLLYQLSYRGTRRRAATLLKPGSLSKDKWIFFAASSKGPTRRRPGWIRRPAM